MNLVITVAVFIAALCILEGIVLMLKGKWDRKREESRGSLRPFRTRQNSETLRTTDITRKRTLSSIPSFHAMLVRIPHLSRIDNLLIQSNFKYPASVFLLSPCCWALSGFMRRICV